MTVEPLVKGLDLGRAGHLTKTNPMLRARFQCIKESNHMLRARAIPQQVARLCRAVSRPRNLFFDVLTLTHLAGLLGGVSLDFPLKGTNGQPLHPYQAAYFDPALPVAPITAIMDHSINAFQFVNGARLPQFYTEDAIAATFTGEIGDASCGNGGALCSICYKQRIGAQCRPDAAFQVNGNYVASSLSDKSFLLFDGHAGFDYAFPVGTPIYAAADGVLSMPTSDPIDGNGCVSPCTPQDGFNPLRIDHGYGYETWYLHVLKGSEIVSPGQTVAVTRGQRIASVGSSGTTAYHLHFEVRKNGVPVDAYGWKGQTADPYLMWTGGLDDKVSATNMNLWNKPPGVADPQVRSHPDGSMLTDGTTTWLIENGKRRRVPSTQVFNAYGFDLHKLIQASAGELTAYAADTDLALPPANRLQRGSAGIFLITDKGFKRLFASSTVFNGLGYKAGDVINVSDAQLASIPNDPAAPILYSPYPEGTLISSNGSIYVITNGTKKQIQSGSIFASLGFNADNVVQAPAEVFNIIAASSDTSACNGSNSSITPVSVSVPATANNGQLMLVAASGCAWNLTGIPPWITIASGVSGQGSATVMFQVAANGGAVRMGALSIAGQTFTVTQASAMASIAVPAAVFRDIFGGMRLTTFGSTVLQNSGGVFASDPGVAQKPNGDTIALARDNFNGIWLNIFSASSQAWAGWTFAGGVLQGAPAVTVTPDGTAWFAGRDSFGAYFLNSYSGGSFSGWKALGGVFGADPSLTATPDGSVYLIARDTYNGMWSGRYIPGLGFQGWVFGGGSTLGKPSGAAGSDNAVYVAMLDPSNAIWMGRVQGNTWSPWQPGRGVMATSPQTASAGGAIYAAAVDASGGVWYNIFTIGVGNNWQGWTPVRGIMQAVSAAFSGTKLYLVAREASGNLWWQDTTGGGWLYVGYPGLPVGQPGAGPR